MARTVAEVIARARAAIGDASGDRASTGTCEGYVRDALNIVRTVRPDAFVGQFDTDVAALVSANNMPIDAVFFMPVSAFVAAMIESQDDQSSDRARGELMSKLGSSLL